MELLSGRKKSITTVTTFTPSQAYPPQHQGFHNIPSQAYPPMNSVQGHPPQGVDSMPSQGSQDYPPPGNGVQWKPKAIGGKVGPLRLSLQSIKELLLLLDIYPVPEKEKITSTSMQQKIVMIRTLTLAASYTNLGSTYIYSKHECDEMIEYNRKCLDILTASLGGYHPDVGISFSKLGNAYFNKGEYSKSIDCNLKSLHILIARLGYNHPDVGSLYTSLGIAYDRNGDTEKAIEYHLKSLNIRYGGPVQLPVVAIVKSKPKMCCFCFPVGN